MSPFPKCSICGHPHAKALAHIWDDNNDASRMFEEAHGGTVDTPEDYPSILREISFAIIVLYGAGWNLYGPYTSGEDKRRRVVMVRGEEKTTRLFAKLRLEVSLGRRLIDDEEVDHIDNDELNDKLENLQPLSRADNIRKSIYAQYGEPLVLSCGTCGEPVIRSASKAKTEYVYCSNSCRARGPSASAPPHNCGPRKKKDQPNTGSSPSGPTIIADIAQPVEQEFSKLQAASSILAVRSNFDRTTYQREYMRDLPRAKAEGLTVKQWREKHKND